jgi:Domain of unknown function (DUF4349)
VRSRLFVLLAAVSLLACQDREAPKDALYSASASQEVVARAPRLGFDRNGQPSRVALEAVVVTGATDPLPPVAPADVTNMVIRTAEVSVEVDSLETAVAQVRQLAAQFGGYVANTDVTTGKNQLRNARLEVKIPAGRFDESLSGLSPIGRLESVTVEAEDVGEQFVDVTARMENAHRLERRLIDLLAARTGKLKDVLDVEQTLARVREEIERYEGRLRYLRAHTAMSTLGIYVHEPIPIVASAGHSVMGEAFKQAWRNFVALAALAVQSLGVVLPLGLVAVVAWVLTRRLRLAKQRTA